MFLTSYNFFVGDHPAQAFERGSQTGGNYKRGNCGCLTNRLAQCPLPTLADLQCLVLQGKYGRKAGILKPSDKLKKAELQENCTKGENWDKQDLASTLIATLMGAQQVPTVLLPSP